MDENIKEEILDLGVNTLQCTNEKDMKGESSSYRCICTYSHFLILFILDPNMLLKRDIFFYVN